jgi:hypothetical protein
VSPARRSRLAEPEPSSQSISIDLYAVNALGELPSPSLNEGFNMALKWVWTWGGESFGYLESDDLWTHDGRHIGRLKDDMIYASDGRYLGELKNGNRLITHQGKSGWRGPAFSPYARRAAYARYANYAGYAMYAGYEDFPAPEDLD